MADGLHVTHLADYGGPYAGSFIPLLRAVNRACDRRGHTLRLVFPRRAEWRPWLTELAEEADVALAEPGELRRDPALIRPPAGDDRRCVVHTHFTRYDVPAALAARRRPGTVVFWHIHTGPSDPDAGLLQRARVRARNMIRFGILGRGVGGILCVAPHMVDELRRRLAPPGKLVFFPNAIDLDPLPVTTPESRSAARRSLGLAPDAEVVLHFGRNWVVKGGDTLVAATALLPSHERTVVVTLRGGDAAAADARRHGLDGVVMPLAGVDDIADAYAAADVLAAPSRTEGMPFTVLEALSTGLPVVASAIPGHAALAGALPGLRLVPVDDPDALAEALTATLGEPHDPELAGRARDWVQEHAGVDAWANRLLDLYEDALR